MAASSSEESRVPSGGVEECRNVVRHPFAVGWDSRRATRILGRPRAIVSPAQSGGTCATRGANPAPSAAETLRWLRGLRRPEAVGIRRSASLRVRVCKGAVGGC